MALSDVKICNLAIGRIAGDPIASLAEDSPFAVFCAEHWPEKRRYLLSKYRWTFANRLAVLTALPIADGAVRPAAYRFAPPEDLNGVVHAWRDGPDLRRSNLTWAFENDGAYWSDQSPLYAEYTAAKPEAAWPAWFVELAVVAFAADLAGFADRSTQQRILEAKAWGTPQENGQGGLFGEALKEDARMAPQRELQTGGVDPGPLVETRFTGPSFAGRFASGGYSIAPPSGQTGTPHDFIADLDGGV